MTLSWIKPPYRALVVGINEYDAAKTLIPPLNGCVADANAIYDFLTQEVGMATTDIQLLTSPVAEPTHKATRANILAGLRDFLGSAPKGSEVLFYYSGHGSYTKLAPDISFGDKQGETLVPADARVGGILDILDRELRFIRAELVKKQIRLTVIADSCFSGDVMRGDPEPAGPMVPRMISEPHSPARALASLLDNTISLSDLQALYAQDDDHTYSLVSGCLATQQSYEVPAGVTRRGVMTTALLNALRAAQAPITYAELGRLLPAFVTAKQLEKQLPNVTGDVERGIFGTEVQPREKPLFAIQTVNTDGTLDIRAGLIGGLDVDSELESYADWSLATSTGKWKITEAKAHSAKAQPLEGVSTPQVGQPLQLLTSSNAPIVYFHPSAQKIQAAWYEDKKVGVPALIETTDETKAQYVVTTNQSDFVARRSDGLIRPTLRKAQQDPRAIYDLARQLNRVATYETFVARQPRPTEAWHLPALNDADGVGLTVEQIDWNGNGTPLRTDGAGTLPAKARLRITVENKTNRDMWVALYLLDEPYFVAERLYPNDSNFHLLPGASRAVTWNNNEWGGGLLPLKLFASSQEIKAADAPKFPCGTRDTNRGSEGSRGLRIVTWEGEGDEGWVTYEMSYGL
jgi:uncharacterized caspase-like protein